MSKCMVFDGVRSLETLDLRLSPTSLSLGASLAPPVFSHHFPGHDPLPDPELPMDDGTTRPVTPTSGPGGPSSS
jgi:hypothetical protein